MEEPSRSGHVISEKGDAADSVDEIRKKRLAYFSSLQKSTAKQHYDGQKSVKNRFVDPEVDCEDKRPNTESLLCQSSEQNARGYSFENTNLGNGSEHETTILSSENVRLATKSGTANQNVSPTNIASNINLSQDQPKINWKSHVEDLFQRGQALQGIDSMLQESHEFKPVSVFKSEVDFDDLGLSTHRPESGVVDGRGDAPISRDITQEMKHLLGEKKYKEFVDKSMKDINELYQNKTTETSPHLMNSLIEKHKHDSSKMEKASTCDTKQGRLPSQDIRKQENDIPLNNNVFKTSTQIPRLNRPRKEPVHIHNIVQKNLKDLETESAGSLPSTVRNYDQVKVPHNVTYSSDEIYRQAFAKAHSQIPPPGYHGVSMGGMSSPEVRPMLHQNLFQHPITSPVGVHQIPVGMPFSYSEQVGSCITPPATPPSHPLFCSPFQPNKPVMNPPGYGYQMPNYGDGYPATSFNNAGSYPMPVFYPGTIDFTQPPPGWGIFNPVHVDRVPHPPAEKKPDMEVNKIASNSEWSSQGKVVNSEADVEDGRARRSRSHPKEPSAIPATTEEHLKPSQRHVEKIRQHHEQRRQKQEDKIQEALQLDKQKQFASASLDRYFSSMENIHRNVDFEDLPAPVDNGEQADDIQYDAGTDTCFTSVSAITETSVLPGGVTERLNNLGIDVKPVIGSERCEESPDGKQKPKMVKVCPECASWNKEYMSWCAECGEILIGVEVIDAKKKKQKDREQRRQQNRLHLAKKNVSSERKTFDDHIGFAASDADRRGLIFQAETEQQSLVSCMEKQEADDNLVIDAEHTQPAPILKEQGTAAPVSETSAPENKQPLMPFLRTEQDINDICDVISDPAIKGFLKSYFRKKSQAAQDVIVSEQKARKDDEQRVRNDKNELAINLQSSVAWAEVEESVAGHKEIDVEIFGREEIQQSQNSSCVPNIVPTLNLAGSSDEDDDKKKKFQPLSFSVDSDDWSSVLENQHEVHQSQNVVLKANNITHSGDAPKPRNSFFSYLLECKPQGRKSTQARPKSADMLEHKRRQAQSRFQESLNNSNYRRHWEKSDLKGGCRRDAVKMSGSADYLTDESVRNSQSLRKTRPASADIYRRKIQFPSQSSSVRQQSMPSSSENTNTIDVVEEVSPRVTGDVPNVVPHRLPPEEAPAVPPIVIHGPTASVVAYSKYRELTPRIREGVASPWLCMPDELWLHVFSFLGHSDLMQCAQVCKQFYRISLDESLCKLEGHSDLMQCAQVCKQFYRISLDESLWQYITVKKKFNINDKWLLQIAGRHPLSLALIQCHGENVTANGLRELFRESANNLKELNFSRCSRGGLIGDSILLHASARCRNLTHVDASWCHVTDNGISAISECAHRLESLCINGCQMLSDEGLETLLKKHGNSLRVLEMFGCFNITPYGIRSLAIHCTNLLTLNLGQCYKLTDSSITHLSASLGRVENLDLRGCKQIKDNCIRKVVRNCPRLKILALANCPNISDAAMIEIATYLNDIRSIDICGCRNVTDHSIKTLANNCQRLNELDLSSTGCTHRSVLLIANYCNRNLETLKLNFLADVTDASLQKLVKHCKKLKLLHLYGCTSVKNIIKLQHICPFLSVEM